MEKPEVKKMRPKIIKGDNSYLVSEKMYDYFQKHAQLYKMDENMFDEHMKEVMKQDINFNSI